jgi:hypothetical protein
MSTNPLILSVIHHYQNSLGSEYILKLSDKEYMAIGCLGEYFDPGGKVEKIA